jgi:nitric oxide reductase activation protein
MLVITDGKAMVGEDGTYYGSYDDTPVEEAREAVEECRESDVDVIGLGIGGMDEGDMRKTFGEGNYRLTSVDDLADDIVEIYGEMMDVSRR